MNLTQNEKNNAVLFNWDLRLWTWLFSFWDFGKLEVSELKYLISISTSTNVLHCLSLTWSGTGMGRFYTYSLSTIFMSLAN